MSTTTTSNSGAVKSTNPTTPVKKTIGKTPEDPLPTHLGFIVDGNRRWARARNLPTLKGHTEGFHKVEMTIDELSRRGIKFASFYLFSTENWGRSSEEVGYLMDLVKNNVASMIKKMKKKNIRTLIMGGQTCPRPDIIELIYAAAEETADCTGMTVCICFNFGGQQEIADAATNLVRSRLAAALDVINAKAMNKAKTKAEAKVDDKDKTKTEDKAANLTESDLDRLAIVTPADFEQHLYCPEVPPVDMIVRTSGEQRISGFQLWRAAYSEFYFIEPNFPDMTPALIDDILAEYSRRHRRFGH